MNIAATVVRTNTDSPKIDCAGVEAGAKILVGLAECPVESASTDQGAQTTSVPLSNLLCEPLIRSKFLTLLRLCMLVSRNQCNEPAAFSWEPPVAASTPESCTGHPVGWPS